MHFNQPEWRDNHLLFGYHVVADLIHIFDVVRQRHGLQANPKGQVDSRCLYVRTLRSKANTEKRYDEGVFVFSRHRGKHNFSSRRSRCLLCVHELQTRFVLHFRTSKHQQDQDYIETISDERNVCM